MKNTFITLMAARLVLVSSMLFALSARATLSVSVAPATLVQQTNTHLAFTATATGGTGVTYAWSGPNGALANGPQSDGSFISGAAAGILLVSNLQTTSSGSYTVTVNDTANDPPAQAGASLTVKASRLRFMATTNIVVARVGDGNELLSQTTGNTVYLDQYQTNGAYVSTIMIPDFGATSLLVCGAGTDAVYEATLNLSSNNFFIDLGGYNTNYPFSGSGTVNSNAHSSRMWSAVNGLGFYAECAGPGQTLNPSGDFAGGGFFMRGVYSTDGLSNWWSVGTTGNNEVRSLPGSGSISEAGVKQDNDIFIQYVTNAQAIVYSDIIPGTITNGLMAISGTPTGGSAVNVLSVGALGLPNDFAVSPDSLTVYICDLRPSNAGGGVQRWDANGTQTLGGTTIPTWALSYTLPLGGTNGACALAVDFSASATWGAGVNGAVLYATTASAYSNSLVRMTDTGAGSLPSATIATGTTNQLLRGVRFAPLPLPVSSVNTLTVAIPGVGTNAAAPVTYIAPTTTNKVTITASGIIGDLPLTYTWALNGVTLVNGAQANGSTIAGATTSALTITGPQAGNAGTYSLSPSNDLGAVAFQATVLDVLGVSISPTSALVPPGATTNFVVTATGVGPDTYQWYQDGSPLTGSTTFGGSTVSGITSSNLQISNVNLNDTSSTFSCMVANVYGSITSSNATLTVANPTFTSSPSNEAVNVMGTVNFTASAFGVPAPSYSWQLASVTLTNGLQSNGSWVSGATTSSLTITNVLCALNNEQVVAVASNSQNAAFSSPATIRVIDPYIVTSPASVYLDRVATIRLSVAALGSGPLTYQWFFNYGPLSDGANPIGDGSSFAGSTNAALTISNPTANEAGSYFVTVTDNSCNGDTTNSPLAMLYFETNPLENQSVWPPAQVVQAGAHVGFYANGDDQGGGPIFYQWYFTNAQGAGSALAGQTNAGLVLSNLASANAGTYAVTLGNAFGTNFAPHFATLAVSNAYIPLSSANLIVARVGDNVQPLSGTTGNTLYLDQYNTNGAYLNSLQVPDTGSTPVVEVGAGADAAYESVLALSSNKYYLNFGGYGFAYPFTGDGTVNNNSSNKRTIVGVNALGYVDTVAGPANGDYTSGSEFFRSVFSTDGLTNFWLLGTTSGNGERIILVGGAAGAFNVSGVNIDNDRCIGFFGTNIVYSDSQVNASGTDESGLEILSGAPPEASRPTSSPRRWATASTILLSAPTARPSMSPTTTNSTQPIPNWAALSAMIPTRPGGGWNWSYTLPVEPGANSFSGATALTVVFPASVSSWGVGAVGAVIYAVTSEASSNNLISIVDNGSSSIPSVLATAGANELLRGVRFGPLAAPFAVSIQPSSQTNNAGGVLTLAATATGYPPLTYQWSLNGANLTNGINSAIDPGAVVSGATGLTLVVSNLSATESGVFTLVVSNVASFVSASATNLVVASEPAPAQFERVSSLGGGEIQLTYAGPSGVGYRLWASTNLALAPITSKWTLVTQGAFGGSATTFTDSTTNGAARFYVITEP